MGTESARQPDQEAGSAAALSRRKVLQAGAGAVTCALASSGGTGSVLAEPRLGGSSGDESVGVRLTAGTNLCAAPAPEGSRVAFDVVNAIWVAGASGEPARRLTDQLQDATQPDWSPDGRRLVFQSYQDGRFHLWVIGVDGQGLRQLTEGGWDHREPRFSPDGRLIAFSSDRSNAGYQIFTLEVDTGRISRVTTAQQDVRTPSWSPDGSALIYLAGGAAIERVQLASGAVRRLVEEDPASTTLFGPSLAPDGTSVGYVHRTGSRSDLMVDQRTVTEGEDVFGFAPRWLSAGELLYTADGRIRRRRLDGGSDEVPFTARVPVRTERSYPRRRPGVRGNRVLGIAGPVCSRDGTRVAFRALNSVWVMVLGQEPRKLVDDGYFASDPDFSPDGRRVVYVSDRGGTADLWLRELDSGAEHRITDVEGAQLAPRFSPDGTRIAYQDQDGATWVAEPGSGRTRQVAPPLFQPGRPDWSPDGRVLVLAAVKPYSRRFREGTSQILRVELDSGALHYTEPLPFRSISTRGDDGPVWSPDGAHLAFSLESRAWVVPVDALGRFTGPPRRVTDELTDSLAWRDAEHLLFLNGGHLRSVHIGTGRTSTIPLRLRWSPARTEQHRAVHVGALWDGHANTLRRGVDIVLAHDRIAAVLPHRPGRPTLEAGELTAIPGLIDAHNHWHLRGRQWGDRQGRAWLAYGITTTRSPGDPAYQMQETREALASGARVGPRYYATGEAIDGSRVYYNFMRPTLSAQQLRLEMERASKLGYDLIKTYVRLPASLQREAVALAHELGVPLTSHYLYPAADIGVDGMEHTGATNRLGYSHTVSELGNAYQDVIDLFTTSGMSITPTLFSSAALYAFDRSLVEDRRTAALFPPWEYESLLAKVEQATGPEGEVWRAELANKVTMLLRIHRGGGFVIAGTDAPLDDVALSLHMNMRAMVRHGFTPHEALTVATRNPARWLGLGEELGHVRPGAYADLALVSGNPLNDITAAAAVHTTIRGGRVYTGEQLLHPFTSPSADRPAHVRGVHRAEPERDPALWWHEPERARLLCCGT
ncbi:Tol biopolymer transport system component [Saccharopolyspora lacisalsi]|uniref:Tol biopolymer transport system component n=1 Tax=Halosaccharopolyspora lacisalsi TaxID=1000566 RepID=A0A839E452_9PSEU|nr:amidohydrolase family protein [Halosaccharopolyspora lacisalsi]MBA8826141.1 Tol biopolymer transport system component [Halosaccharopolyspora lacisalsi]